MEALRWCIRTERGLAWTTGKDTRRKKRRKEISSEQGMLARGLADQEGRCGPWGRDGTGVSGRGALYVQSRQRSKSARGAM